MCDPTVLILGGTAEARALAADLVARGVDVVSSLAGRVKTPRLPVGAVRIGGFGGIDGLRQFLRDASITRVIDATHPFASTMTAHGQAACAAESVPFVRFARPGWRTHPLAHTWTWVTSYDDAREAADRLGTRPFITTGRQTLSHYADAWADRTVLVRVVEPLDDDAPASWRVVLDRGPYTVDGERELMERERVGVLLTKDSGGAYTSAKLDAAQALDIPVVVVSRPAPPSGVPEVAELAEAVAFAVLQEPPN